MQTITHRLIIILFLTLAIPETSTGADFAPQVQTVQPQRGEIIRFVTLPGSIHANQQATLYARVGGYLGKVTVDKGDSVRKGQLLAEIEVPELDADLRKFKADAKLAEAEDRRLREAGKRAPDLIVPIAVDKAEAALEVSLAEISRIETMQNFAKIKAPFDGVITMRYLDPGAFVPAASTGSVPDNAALFTLADFSIVRMQIAIPEADASLVKNGQPIKFTVEGLPGQTFTGSVTRFSYELDGTLRAMLVEADIPNASLVLRPGMYARASIGVEKHPDVLLLPKGAIVTEKASSSVMKSVDGKARKTPIKVGFDDGLNVEVLEGVLPNEKIILPGKRPLIEGQAIQTIEPK